MTEPVSKAKTKGTRNMKIAVISFSGNVGKTTVARQLLAPRMKDAREFSIETINASASDSSPDAEQLSGKETGDLLRDLLLVDQAIADFGASNVEDALRQLALRRGAHEEFDYYLVPVVGNVKQEADAVNTIKALSGLGVPARKILVVFNNVPIDDANDVKGVFPIVYGYHQDSKTFTLHPKAVIFQNEIFDQLQQLKMTVAEIVADETDYRAVLANAKDEDAKHHAADRISAKWMAVTAHENLDVVFKELFA